MSAKSKVAALNAKIAELTAKRDALQLAADNEVDLTQVAPGVSVEATFGRGDTRKTIAGVVKGTKTNDKNVLFVKIEIGTGVDAEFVTVLASTITKVIAAPADEVETVTDAS